MSEDAGPMGRSGSEKTPDEHVVCRAALLALLAGLLLRAFQGDSPLSSGCMLGGGISLVSAVVLHGRSVARTRHHRQGWSRRDTAVALFGGLGALAYVAVRLTHPEVLAFIPYPRLHWPDFHPAVGAILMTLTAPAWLYTRRPR